MNKTKRKWLLRGVCLLLFLIVAAALLLPPTRVRIFGYLRGEHFFDGMPTSYWREVVKDQVHRRGPRTPTFWDKVLGYLGLDPPPPPWMAGPTRDAAFPVLLEFLKDDDPKVRLFAANALRLVGKGHVARPVVIELLTHDDWNMRLDARRLLRAFDIPLSEAVPALLRDLERYPESRSDTLSGLARAGRDARPALPVLLKLLESEQDVFLAHVVWLIDPDNALARSLLVQGLQDDKFLPAWGRRVCEQLLAQFRSLGPAKHAGALILEVLRDPRAKLSALDRQMLLEALAEFDPEAADQMGPKEPRPSPP